MIKKAVAACVIVFVLIILFSSMFVVTEGEYVCIIRFGKIIDTKDSAGLYFKAPFIDSKLTLPNKKILYNLPASNVLTKDKKDMVIDNYVIWYISDPVEFVKSIGYISEAERRIDAAVYNTVKNTMGTLEQNSIINEKLSGRGEFDKIVTDEVSRQLSSYGITVYDVKIKKLDLPVENEETVYERMISEREKIAEQYKAEGQYEANKIKNEVDKQVNIIISEAKASAQELIGEGEAEYIKILSEAYSGEKKEFYEYVKTLEAMKASLKGEKTLILPINSPITKYFKDIND
ncbi:protease modulator HflC [Acetivibrio straminisolvens]|jgi:membrane protease subunit HflC|uniref:protease modulator HflC n=1 Tax=Acetivibrio straminisolvens TaxID=253314 RepID=UPI00223FAF9A|nr:protease modulator HflC [Acetivibrio straminisolvens]